MTPKLALFTLIFGAAGGLLFGWAAACLMRKWDFPDGLRYGVGRHRQRIQLRIVMSAMVLGGMFFAAVVSAPAWAAEPFLEVDFNADEIAEGVFGLDLVRFIILCISGVAAVAFVAKAWGNRVERRKSGTDGESQRGDLLLKIATKDDLQQRFEHLEQSLRRALDDHDQKNNRDFSELRDEFAKMRKHIDKMVEASNSHRNQLDLRVTRLEDIAKKGDSNR